MFRPEPSQEEKDLRKLVEKARKTALLNDMMSCWARMMYESDDIQEMQYINKQVDDLLVMKALLEKED